MENAIGTVVAYWFVVQLWATIVTIILWLVWQVSMLRGK